MPSKPVTFKHHLWAALVLAVICIFSYGNTLNNGFLLDDHTLLIGETTLDDVSYGTLFQWGFKTAYRPVAFSFMKASLAVFGEHPTGYHAVNIILFLGICVLFYLILLQITRNFTTALLPVCLFAAHPINNFLVNYKTAGCLSLYVIIMQLAFILFLLYFDRKKNIYYWMGLFTYFVCLFTHEITFIFPLYIFFLAYLLKEKSLKQSALLCLPFAVPFIIFFVIRTQAIKSHLITSIFRLEVTLEQYVALLSKLIYWYNSKILIPKDIIFIWDETIAGQKVTLWMIAGIVSVLSVWLFTILRGRGSLKAFALSLYCAGFIPTVLASFSYATKLDTAMIEPHWFVFSSIGLFLLIVLLISDAQKKIQKPFVAAVCIAILTILMGVSTRSGNAVWADDATYCEYWMNLNPLNGSAYQCRARAYVRAHDRGDDINSYESCEDIADVAGAYHHMGHNKISLRYYLMALKKDGQCIAAFYGLGTYYMDEEKYKMAEGALRTMIALAPNKREAYTQLIKVYQLWGKDKEALELQSWLDEATAKAIKND